MSETTPVRRSAWVLAAIVLGIVVSAGLLVYFSRGTETAAISESPDQTNERADVPVASSVEPPPASIDGHDETNETVDVPLPNSVEPPPASIDRHDETDEMVDVPVPTSVEPPPASIDGHADRAATDALLTELQNKIQRLEEDVATLQKQRKRIDDVLIQQADRIKQEAVSATRSPAPVEEVPAADRTGLDEALEQLGALPTKRGHLIALGEPEFSFNVGRTEFASGKPPVLEEIAEVLMRYEHLLARIEGHSDSKGNTQRNQQLTQDRAQSVRVALSEEGIDPDRIQAQGFGGMRPITDNRTIAARERNRRIEIYLIEP